MEPIVNPWLIYFIFQVDQIKHAFVGFGVVLAFVGIIVSVAVIVDGLRKTIFFYSLPALFLGIIFLFTAMFCPGKNTIVAMYAAGQITPDRVSQGMDYATEAKESLKGDIIEIIQSITEKGK